MKKIALSDGMYSQNVRFYTLYKTPKGKYFLHGEGGAASKYAEHSGRNLDAGSEIIEYSRKDALEWLSQNGFNETIEKELPDLIEEA